jgi:hypothetical protein
MLTPIRHVALWPLRQMGLESGRALQNANPSPAQRQAARAQQFAYIKARLADSGAMRPGAFSGSETLPIARWS